MKFTRPGIIADVRNPSHLKGGARGTFHRQELLKFLADRLVDVMRCDILKLHMVTPWGDELYLFEADRIEFDQYSWVNGVVRPVIQHDGQRIADTALNLANGT